MPQAPGAPDDKEILQIAEIVQTLLQQYEISLSSRADWELVTKAFMLGIRFERDGVDSVKDILKMH